MWVYVILGILSVVSFSALAVQLLSVGMQTRPWYYRLGHGISAAGTLWLLRVLLTSPHPDTTDGLTMIGAVLVMYVGTTYQNVLAAVMQFVVSRSDKVAVRHEQSTVSEVVWYANETREATAVPMLARRNT